MHWLHSFAPAISALLVVALGKSIAVAKLAKISGLAEGKLTLPEDEEPAPPGISLGSSHVASSAGWHP